jgi:hypothetical protein
MLISPDQSRAGRALFAMTQQELADAAGVSLRTITSFEDLTERRPTAANLAAIQWALQRLGVLFTGGAVEWVPPPFSGAQVKVLRALEVRSGPAMCTAATLHQETDCSRAELEALVQLRVIEGIDGLPLLTPIGRHISQLLRAYEAREAQSRWMCSPSNYTVHPTDGTVFHARTAAVYRVGPDGNLTPLFEELVPEHQRGDVIAGAREALRLHRERDPRVEFRWHRP